MIARIVLGVVIGGGIGLAVGSLGRSMGGQCPIACNPYISTGVGVLVGLILASRGGTAESFIESANIAVLGSDREYADLVAGAEGLLLVEFFTNNCPYCVKQMPAINAIADRFAGRVQVAVANARRLPGTAEREGIRGVPSALLVRGGQTVARLVGYKPESELVSLLEDHLEQTEAAQDTDDQREAETP